MGDRARRRVWAVVVVLLAAPVAAACSDDDGTADDAAVSSTTGSTLSFEERDTVTQLSSAATGMSLVANDISLRALQGSGAEYCRMQAPAELAPHRTTLEGAADDEVRRRAQAALGDLDSVVDACAGGGDQAALQDAIQKYGASFQQLRQRLDQLLAAVD